jgi:hypothetical protein
VEHGPDVRHFSDQDAATPMVAPGVVAGRLKNRRVAAGNLHRQCRPELPRPLVPFFVSSGCEPRRASWRTRLRLIGWLHGPLENLQGRKRGKKRDERDFAWGEAWLVVRDHGA